MSYCINPTCPDPARNSPDTDFCLSCGNTLLLKDRYRAQQRLGQGGFGKTFKAVDEDRPRKPMCVIKQFAYSNADLQIQQAALRLFYEEARHLEALGTHPQIPELLAYFDISGQPYLVQEFIHGQDLARELKSEGTFDGEQIRELLASLLPVLDFLHHQSIPVIHRDLKPANIIRRHSDRKLVVVDFGSAKQATQAMLGQTGSIIGSPEYSAPEQIKGKPTFASDIFSLGVTCIHLLTHVSPFDLFDVNSDEWIWRDYLQNNPVDPQLGSVLDKMIANSLSRRYQSAVEVLRALSIENKSASVPNPLADSVQLTSTLQTAQYYINRADIREKEQDFSKALADYDKAIELDPQSAYHSQRGCLKGLNLNDRSGAMADLDKAIELDPQDAKVHIQRGCFKWLILDDRAGAMADLDKAIELDPQNGNRYHVRGSLKLSKLNDRAGAMADFNKAIELDPQDAATYANRAYLKDLLNDVSGAMADYDKAIELNPQEGHHYYRRGVLKDILISTKGFAKFKRWVFSYGNHDGVNFNDLSGALSDYNKAIELLPEYAHAYYARGVLKKNQIKDKTGAIQDFRRAASLYRQQDGISKYIGYSITYLEQLGVSE
jgi:serine/threonine protein kinase